MFSFILDYEKMQPLDVDSDRSGLESSPGSERLLKPEHKGGTIFVRKTETTSQIF
jgi:hypothetical protein